MRTTIYIDGFNLYYRALRNTPHKWLDPKALCEKVLSNHNKIDHIKYFTAYVTDRATGDGSANRQKLYLGALKAYIPEIEIIPGHFSVHSKTAPLVTPGDTLDEKEVTGRGQHLCSLNNKIFSNIKSWKNDPGPLVNIINTEEKGSDVNLAVHLVNDGWKNEYDCCVVISNDSDLAESLRIAKDELNKSVGLISLRNQRPTHKLKRHTTFVRTARDSAFSSCQLPNKIPGTKIEKPTEWN